MRQALLQEILSLSRTIEETASHLPFHPSDVRRTYFQKTITCLNDYYYGQVNLEICRLIKTGVLRLSDRSTASDRRHLNIFAAHLCEKEPDNFLAGLNRHLVVDTWTAFEICIALVLEGVLPVAKLQELQLYMYSEVVKVLRKNSHPIDESIYRRLRAKLTEKHPPINRKVAAVYRVGRDRYTRSWKQDIEFLNSYARLRNSMHNNFVYYGKDCDFEVERVQVRFRDGEFVWFSADEQNLPGFLLALVRELTDIFGGLVEAVRHEEAITDPMVGEARM